MKILSPSILPVYWILFQSVIFNFFPLILFHCAVPENIHTPPTEGFLFSILHPPGNSSLASYVASKILTFKTPLPLGVSDDRPRWGGYGFFLELQIAHMPHIDIQILAVCRMFVSWT